MKYYREFFKKFKDSYKYLDAQPLVFSEALDAQEFSRFETDSFAENIKAPPFKRFTLEIEGTIISHASANDDKSAEMHMILVDEVAPNSFNLFFVAKMNILGSSRVIPLLTSDTCDISEGARSVVNQTVNALLARLDKQQTGTFNPKPRVAYLKGRKKLRTKISDVIYVTPKKYAANNSSTPSGEPVKWDHAWAVRGHWRKLNNPLGFGVDREFQRNVKGFTWIAPHVKGEGQLVTKTRIVK
jgi:hypothetical protein